eukprot:scaffold215457_cov24-Attheya_sp.AAC.1
MADIMGVDPGDVANMSKTERLQRLTASLKGMNIPRTKGNNQANVTEGSEDESSDEDDDSDSDSSDDDSDASILQKTMTVMN